jgi:hypothetical protein
VILPDSHGKEVKLLGLFNTGSFLWIFSVGAGTGRGHTRVWLLLTLFQTRGLLTLIVLIATVLFASADAVRPLDVLMINVFEEPFRVNVLLIDPGL